MSVETNSLFRTLTALGIVGVIVSLAVSAVRSKIKETSQVLGVGTLYGAIFVALFLAPFPPKLIIGQSSSDCSHVEFVITPGYGSDHGSEFSNYVCYEDLDSLMKCIRNAAINYENDVMKANKARNTCQGIANAGLWIGGLFCIGTSIWTGGTTAVPCTAGVSATALAGLAYCRGQHSIDLYDAASDADCAIQICLSNHQAPQSMINGGPYGSEIIRLPHPQYLQD